MNPGARSLVRRHPLLKGGEACDYCFAPVIKQQPCLCCSPTSSEVRERPLGATDCICKYGDCAKFQIHKSNPI